MITLSMPLLLHFGHRLSLETFLLFYTADGHFDWIGRKGEKQKNKNIGFFFAISQWFAGYATSSIDRIWFDQK